MRKKILIIEDEPRINAFYQFVFEDVGMLVEPVKSLSDARSKINAFSPDFVLLDLMVGGESGLDFLDEYAKDFDVFVVSNLKDKEDEALARGATAFFLKSRVSPEELVAYLIGA